MLHWKIVCCTRFAVRVFVTTALFISGSLQASLGDIEDLGMPPHKRARTSSPQYVDQDISIPSSERKLRISFQTASQEALDILKQCKLRVIHNGVQEFPLQDCTAALNERASITGACNLDLSHPLFLEFEGTDLLTGQRERVLTTKHIEKIMPLSTNGQVLVALRIIVELRAATQETPTFIRGTFHMKYQDPTDEPSFIAPNAISYANNKLTDPNTLENDAQILRDVLEESSLMSVHPVSRKNRYMGIENIELTNRTIYIIGDYISRAQKKYGTNSIKQEELMNFFIHHNVISRSEISAYKDQFET